MFKSIPMRKINVFVLEEHVEDVTVALARLKAFHVTGTPNIEKWTEAGGRWSGLADQYHTQTRRLAAVLQTLQIERTEAPAPAPLEPRSDVFRIEDGLYDAEREAQAWSDRRHATEQNLEQLRLLRQSVRQLAPLDVPVERLRELEYLYLSVGTMRAANLADLEIALFRIPFVIIPVHEHDDRVLIFAASAQEHGAILERALQSAYMEPLELPDELTGSPGDVLDELEGRIAEADQRLTRLEEERDQLAQKHGERLLSLWRQARSNAAVAETMSQFSRHGRIYLLAGWVPEPRLEDVIAVIRETTDDEADVQILEPRAEGRRQAPTLLRNPRWLQPFEYIVSTFGFPGYDEIDPTPLVALTFVLMYGMMFGDVGHGLLLALAGLGLYRRGDAGAGLAPALILAGVSGIFFGFLYGSVFGVEHILPHLWLSPLERIQDILIASVIAGIALLNVGFLLHLVSTWWSRDWGSLLFDTNGLAGIWLYWALLGGGLAVQQGLPLPTSIWLLMVLIPVVLIFLHEPLCRLVIGERPLLEGSWGEYGVESFFELFEAVIGYVGNSPSFVRLGAFAVAHAGLSRVVFVLADLAGDPGGWIVIGLGTALIVGFEGFIVGIQTLRLEYYEFFGKFFQGTGLQFTPLQLPEEQRRSRE